MADEHEVKDQHTAEAQTDGGEEVSKIVCFVPMRCRLYHLQVAERCEDGTAGFRVSRGPVTNQTDTSTYRRRLLR